MIIYAENLTYKGFFANLAEKFYTYHLRDH